MVIDREQFEANRREGLGSTDSSAILRRSPWAGPLSVYQDKVGEAPEREPSLPMWLGLQLQRTVGELFMTREGKRLRADNIQHKHPVLPYVRCHLDYRVIGERSICEVKTARSAHGWGAEGTAEVPVQYWIQVQHQMAVTGLDFAYIATLFGHYDYKTYEVPRDDSFINELLPALQEFWELHVIPRVPPPLDGSSESTRVVNGRWPRDTEPSIPATPEQAELVRELITARRELKLAIFRDTEWVNKVKDQVGIHGGWDGPDFTVSWRHGKGWTKTEWKWVAKAYRKLIEDARDMHDMDEAGWDDWGATVRPDQLDAIVGLHSEEREGTRPFILAYQEPEEQSDGQTQVPD